MHLKKPLHIKQNKKYEHYKQREREREREREEGTVGLEKERLFLLARHDWFKLGIVVVLRDLEGKPVTVEVVNKSLIAVGKAVHISLLSFFLFLFANLSKVILLEGRLSFLLCFFYPCFVILD